MSTITEPWLATPPAWMGRKQLEKAESLCREVAEKSEIEPESLFLNRRGPDRVSRTRQLCMVLMRQQLDMTFEDIGAYFSGRDHGTVIHAMKAVHARTTRKNAEPIRSGGGVTPSADRTPESP